MMTSYLEVSSKNLETDIYVASKVFLIGEYAILSSGGGILLSLERCFQLKVREGKGQVTGFSHGPCQGLLEIVNEKRLDFEFIDPYERTGGFGSSSAQFLALWIWICHVKNRRPFHTKHLKECWELFLNYSSYVGSGGDLISQYSSSSITYFSSHGDFTVKNFSWPFFDKSFIVTKTPWKTTTHIHLKTLSDFAFGDLSIYVQKALKAFSTKNWPLLNSAINEFHQALVDRKLVDSRSLELICEIQSWDKVGSVKGCGASGSDAILICCDSEDRSEIVEKIKKQGLKVMNNHLTTSYIEEV